MTSFFTPKAPKAAGHALILSERAAIKESLTGALAESGQALIISSNNDGGS